MFLIEDSLPNGRVGPDLTPTLWSLIEEGGWHPDGGVSVLASSTYPNHATFATGVDVHQHRVFTNDIWNGIEFVCSSTIGPATETMFQAARRAGVSTAAILGDQTMVGCMGAAEADVHWPPDGALPEGTPLDCLGYAANEAVINELASSSVLDADLVYIHMNDPDSTLHWFGPDAPETLQRIREIDDDLATVVDLLRPRWSETVLFVVSDHEQEAVDTTMPPIDLAAELERAGMPGDAHNEGTVGIVYNSPGPAMLERLDVVEGSLELDAGITLVWSNAGRVFGRSAKTGHGQHGSPRTRTQVASVSGGHPVVAELASDLANGFGSPSGRVEAMAYANVIANLLGVSLHN